MATLSSEAFYNPEQSYRNRVNMGRSIGESLKGVTGAVLSAGQYLADKANKKQLIDEMNQRWKETAQYNDQFMSMTPDKLAEKVFIIKNLDEKAKAVKQNIGEDVSLPSPVMLAMEMPSVAQLGIATGAYDDIAKNLLEQKDKKETGEQMKLAEAAPTVEEAYGGIASQRKVQATKPVQDYLKVRRDKEIADKKGSLAERLAKIRANNAKSLNDEASYRMVEGFMENTKNEMDKTRVEMAKEQRTINQEIEDNKRLPDALKKTIDYSVLKKYQEIMKEHEYQKKYFQTLKALRDQGVPWSAVSSKLAEAQGGGYDMEQMTKLLSAFKKGKIIPGSIIPSDKSGTNPTDKDPMKLF